MAINPLDKIKGIQLGLHCCRAEGECANCPYNNKGDICLATLHDETLEVIDALKEEVKKRTDKAARNKPGFIILTSKADYPLSIRVSDISVILDTDYGSSISIKDNNIVSVLVKEKIEEILNKIAESYEKEE